MPSVATSAPPRPEIRISFFLLFGIVIEHRRHKRRVGIDEHWTAVIGEDALSFRAPERERSLRFGGFAEDEAKENVETAKGEEEESGHEGEIVDVVGKDASRNPRYNQGI